MHYVLTVYRRDFRVLVKHFRILQMTSGRFHLENEQVNYPTLAELIEDHARYQRTLRGPLKWTPKGPFKYDDSPAMEPCYRTTTVLQERQGETYASRANVERSAQPKLENIWEIDLLELELMGKIGTGSFGVVHQAMLRGTALVAVKMLARAALSDSELVKDAKIMT